MSNTIDYRILFQGQPVPTLVLQPDDPCFTINDVNKAYLQATKTESSDLIGKSLFVAFPDNPADREANGVSNLYQSLRQVLTSGRLHTMAVQRYDIPVRGTEAFEEKYWQPVNIPVQDGEGKVIAILHQVQDVTEWVKAGQQFQDNEHEVRLARGFLKNAEEASGFGTWVLDLENNRLSWSDGVFRICGYEPRAFEVTFDRGLSVIHPDDRQAAIDHMRQCLENKAEYRIQKRFITRDHKVRHILSKGSLLRNEKGEPVKLIGIFQDITEQWDARQDLKVTKELFQTLVQTIEGIFWEADAQTYAFRYVSPQVQQLLGYTPEEWLGDECFWQKHLHPDDRDRAIHYCHDQTCRGQSHHFEYRFLHASGSYRWYQDVVTVIMEEGQPRWLRGLMVDITEKRKLEEQLANQKKLVQKRVTEAYVQAQERERNELGRELHDNINQVLASVKMFLRIAIEEESKRDRLLPKCYENISYAMQEIRNLCRAMVAPSLGTKKLPVVLQELAEEYSLSAGLQVSLSYEAPAVPVLDPQLELMVFRIVQEQLHNIIKHAGASEVAIRLRADRDQLNLEVTDNGKGFEVSSSHKGIGLLNIKNRVAFYNGTVSIDAAPGSGCRIRVSIPLPLS